VRKRERLVLNWKMAGTKHPWVVSEAIRGIWAYLQGVGSLFRLGFYTQSYSSLRSAIAMSTGDTGSRRVDRRRAPRYAFQASLEIEWGSARLKARTRDISVSGMFIESEDVLWVGAGFRARLVSERPLWLECLVKRVEPGLGMGVTVAHPEDQSIQHYQELLARLALSG